MNTKLRKAMLPIYIISKLILQSPFSLGTEKTNPSYSHIGTIYSLTGLILYDIFHILSANQITEMIEGIPIEAKDMGLVSILIDLYNRYSGVLLCSINIFIGIVQQRKIVKFITIMENIDSDFERNLTISDIGNAAWMRYTKFY